MSTAGTAQDRTRESGWVLGGVALAATVMVVVGVFQAIQGLAAIIDDEFFVTVRNYAFEIDVTAWGWIHLIIGVILVLAGAYLFSGSVVASTIAIGLAMLSAVANFFFIPHYPFWSILIIALDVFVIWAIIRARKDLDGSTQ
jgi:hypothetical protein